MANNDPLAPVMGLMRRVSSSDWLDKTKTRKPVERVVFEASRAGFKAIALTRKGIKPVLNLVTPARMKRSAGAELFDLNFTDEQEQIRDSVRRIADEIIAPAAAAADEACETPTEILQQVREIGHHLIAAPESAGGIATERPIITNMLITEELARGDMGIAVAALTPIGVLNALLEWGTANQQNRYLPLLMDDDPVSASFAINEPSPISKLSNLQTTARKKGGSYILNGEKSLVPLGAQSEFLLVLARIEGTAKAVVFIVDSDTEGVEARPEPAMGVRAAATARVRLSDVTVSPKTLLGGEESEFDLDRFVALNRIGSSALACGTATAVRDYVIPYVKDRSAFGEPIAHRQSVAFMIANTGIELDGMQLMNWRAAAKAERDQAFERQAYLAHYQAAEKGMAIGSDGVQLLGGHGFVKEHPVERWYRDLRSVAIMQPGVMV